MIEDVDIDTYVAAALLLIAAATASVIVLNGIRMKVVGNGGGSRSRAAVKHLARTPRACPYSIVSDHLKVAETQHVRRVTL